MTEQHKLAAVRALVELARPHFANVPPEQRASLYEGVAVATAGLDEGMSRGAQQLADQLRETELMQGKFWHDWTEQEPA